jgi:hypothetical protein
MKYQIQITDLEGYIYIVAILDDLHQAQKKLENLKLVYGPNNFLFNFLNCRSIELCRVDVVLGAHFDVDAESR